MICKNCNTSFVEPEKPAGTYKYYNYRGGSEKLRYVFCPKCTYHVYLDEPKVI